MRHRHRPAPSALPAAGAPSAWLRRRRWLQACLAGALPLSALQASAQTAPAPLAAPSADSQRLALLLGNREYPDDQDLPPIHRNVAELRPALEQRGFVVTQGLDLDRQQAAAVVAAFAAQVRAAPPDATVLFYFAGHGAQVDGGNLLVPARQHPKARPDALMRGSLALARDVIDALPRRPEGLTIAVVDACRTSLREVATGEGLNQVEAPPGCLIAFATGAGRPAIAPADENRTTFYTASLVKLLREASGEITFSDLFRLVKFDVQETMQNHPVPLLRQFAQVPFIAENIRVQRRLTPAVVDGDAAPAARFATGNEAADWARLEQTLWPGDVARLAGEFLARHGGSRLAGSAQVARQGASEAAAILQRNDVRLFRSAFQPDEVATADELAKAGRGDKDAAARLARGYGRSGKRLDSARYEGWLQYAAALGNGIASYELALHYRRTGQPALAGQFEARALALGYTPPPSLDNSRK